MQAFSALAPPSSVTITVQAPQSPSLQPSFVPQSPFVSRKKSRSVRVGASPATRIGVPLSRNAISDMYQPAAFSPVQTFCAPARCGVKRTTRLMWHFASVLAP